MKRLAYIFLAVTAMAGFYACADEASYEPGPQAEGPQYYFSTNEPTSVNVNQNTKTVSIDVFRMETTSAATLSFSVADESGLISSSSSATASFSAGSNKATVSFPINPGDFTFAVDYPVTYKISSDTTPYGMSEITVKYKYPTPLTLLGDATVTENFMTGETFTAPVYQSQIDPNEFHINKFMGGSSDDLIIHVVKAGDTFRGVTFTIDGLVYFADAKIGLTYADVGGGSADEIYILHPTRFTSLASEANCVNSKVTVFQDNGIPAVVELAPYYYMFGLGGWNKISAPQITIVFPGYDPKDYAVDAAYAGIFTDKDGAVYGEANVTLGEDVENGVAVLVAGDSDEAIAAGIEALKAGDESVVAFSGSTVRVALPEGAQTGRYTIIVGAVAEGEVQETSLATFFYQAGSVTIDWDWLVGDWNAQDLEGAPYKMTVTKVDETTAIFHNIWDMDSDITGTVDFEAKTIAFKGPFNLGAVYGNDALMMAHYDAEAGKYDDGVFYATMSESGITITGHGYYVVGGSHDGDDFGLDTTKMTK